MHSFHNFGTPTLTMEIIKGWASDACSKHVADGADPTAMLTKLASDNSLTPHQIEVVAGEINRAIHTVKYAAETDKYNAAGFPLADAKVVVQSLQAGGETKVASAGYAFVDPIVDNGMDYHSAFGIQVEAMDKTAATKCATKAMYEKVASEARQQSDKVFMAEQEKFASEAAYIKTARQYILEGFNPQERFVKLCEVEHSAHCANMLASAGKPLAKVAHSLGAEGFLLPKQAEGAIEHFLNKTADEKAPEELISPFLQARVVNGNHPLIITLKTYANACEREQQERGRDNLIKDKLGIMAQKIRAL
jgi:hypothetical protein